MSKKQQIKEFHESMRDMKKSMDNVSHDIGEIKLDLREHIRRTDALETMVMPLHNAKTGFKWVGGFLSIIAVLYSLYSYFGV